MKKYKRLITSVIFFGLACFARGQTPTVKVTVEVVDLGGQPIAGADVGIGGGLGTEEKIRKANGKTDLQGHFTGEIGSAIGEVSSFARHEGYYENRAPTKRLFKDGNEALLAVKSGHWNPEEQTIRIVLRPVKSPVPMYVKDLNAVFPVVGKPVGYDLEVGDWIAPYGEGKHADFEFLLEGQSESMTNYTGTLTLSVPGKYNGIQAYDLSDANATQLFYEAPYDGYVSTWKWQSSRLTENKPYATSVIEDDAEPHPHRKFIFRVRSIVDSQGRLQSAWYGKINGPGHIGLRSDLRWQIQFIHYLNPDLTRNLEFDPKKNLLPDQNVSAP